MKFIRNITIGVGKTQKPLLIKLSKLGLRKQWELLQILSRETQKTFTPKIAASPKIVDITDISIKTSANIQKSIVVKTSKKVQP